MSDHQKVLSKIRKLLKLSEGKADLNESATAAEMAQRLMEEYRIKQTELELYEDVEEEDRKSGIRELFEYEGVKATKWKVDLAGSVASANGCAHYYIPGYKWTDINGNRRVQPARINLSGTKQNFDTCFYMFYYLLTTIELLCKKQGKGKGRVWAQSFRTGAVNMIRSRLMEAKRKAREDLRKAADQNSTALVRLDDAIAKVDSELNEARQFLHSRVKLKLGNPSSTTLDKDGYSKGQTAAKTIKLTPGGKGNLTSGKPQLK